MSIGRNTTVRRLRLLGLGVLAATVISACSPIVRHHGYIPPETDLASVTVGRDTRETVAAALGTPSSAGLTNDSGYYYVASEFRTIGPMAPREVSREVLAISFDSRGVVSNIERFGLENGRVVVLSRRVTQDNVRDTTLIRQLMGNFGRLDASALIAAPRN